MMSCSSEPIFPRSGYTIRQLCSAAAPLLQGLFEQCSDFFTMTNGAPASPTAAAEEFVDVPEGKTPDDIYVFSLFDKCDRLLGALIAVRHYPDHRTWWIGLMLLAPQVRGQKLGQNFYQAFEHWVAAQGDDGIALCAIAENTTGRQFWERQGFAIARQAGPRTYDMKTHEVLVYRRSVGIASRVPIAVEAP